MYKALAAAENAITFGHNDNEALDNLKNGESWNDNVKNNYDVAHSTYFQHGLWVIVLTSSGTKRDWNEVQALIGGIHDGSHADKLKQALDAWGPNDYGPDLDSAIKACVSIMEALPPEDHIIQGPHLWAVLRSAFSEDAGRLFRIVRNVLYPAAGS